MMRERFAAISLMLVAAYAMAQPQQPAPTAPAAATPTSMTVKKHYLTAPELLSVNGTFSAPDHCKKLDGEEELLIAVDLTGSARTIKFLKPLANDLDAMALHVVELDKFKPGTVDGAPGVATVADHMKLQACRMEKKDENGQKQKYLELRSAPEQAFELVEPPNGAPTETPPKPETAVENTAQPALYRVGGAVTPPVLLHQVDPEYSDEARRARYQGICVVSIIVDVKGNPQNPRVVQPLGMGLDEKALEAVKQYRFKPAMKDGKTPVPVMVKIQVNFRL
jgi:TonB family protein